MSQDLGPHSPIRPLSIGNVVSASIQLYSSHLKPYLGISLRATLWSLLPIVVLIVPVIFLALGRFEPPVVVVAVLVLLLVWTPLLLYCLAKYWLNSALISRLAFGELTSAPESISAARVQLNSRLWLFLGVAFWAGLLLTLVATGVAIVAAIVSLVIGVLIGLVLGWASAAPDTNTGAALILGIFVFLVFFLLLIAGVTWFYSRWIISEVPMAVEGELDFVQSVGRSWDLSKGSVFRIQGAVLIAFLVTLPILSLTSYVPQLFLIGLEPYSSTYWTIYGVSVLTSLAGGLLILPFWQAMKAVLYYDLRSRREGLDLQLRHR